MYRKAGITHYAAGTISSGELVGLMQRLTDRKGTLQLDKEPKSCEKTPKK